MLYCFQSNLKYNSSTILCYWGVQITLCMYILDWNCFHDNVYSFQSLPFSRTFREIRLEKWVNGSPTQPTQPTLYKQCIGSLTYHSILYEQGPWDRAYRFLFYSKKTRKCDRLQMTSESTLRQLFKNPVRRLVRPGFETAASHSVDRCLYPPGANRAAV